MPQHFRWSVSTKVRKRMLRITHNWTIYAHSHTADVRRAAEPGRGVSIRRARRGTLHRCLTLISRWLRVGTTRTRSS
jgi:hypothetical protein